MLTYYASSCCLLPAAHPLTGQAFLTSDYSKRDEFSLTVRMEQHREIIKASGGGVCCSALQWRGRGGGRGAPHAKPVMP